MNWYVRSQLEKKASAKQLLMAIVLLWLNGTLSLSAAEQQAKKSGIDPRMFGKVVEVLPLKEMRGKTDEEKTAILDKLLNRDASQYTPIHSSPAPTPPQPKVAPKPLSTPSEVKPAPKVEPTPETTPKNDITVDQIVQVILEQEGVLKSPGKTPVFLSGKWRDQVLKNGIALGKFEVDTEKTSKSQFIYLKNPDDVPKIVRYLLETYYPGRYGLSNSPTLKEMLRVFDQSNSSGKMEYMKQHLPKLDLDKPLSHYKG